MNTFFPLFATNNCNFGNDSTSTSGYRRLKFRSKEPDERQNHEMRTKIRRAESKLAHVKRCVKRWGWGGGRVGLG